MAVTTSTPVPPKVADAAAQAHLDIAVDVVGPVSVRAARSSKRLKIAHDLYANKSITESELGEHERFHVACALLPDPAAVAAAAAAAAADTAAAVVVPDVPPWFAQAIQVSLAPIQAQLAQLQPMQAQLTQLQAQLNNIEARQLNSEARQLNIVASDPSDPLQGITNAAGHVFPQFPNTLGELHAMDEVQMTAFLHHHGLDVPCEAMLKMVQIKQFIGRRIA
ncbi:DUF3294 domain containing protein [Nitzschia inconspicua]|uniref:DUF3294 domain containing protein n=1 Tax=Nitzschia inconspicua TaxID=303405 RepID=A0A9K3PZ68_9STRA|nr:DUF3294 domain containing protein [Nitzschia inconspicua]